mgnify:CR=1 FL=1
MINKLFFCIFCCFIDPYREFYKSKYKPKGKKSNNLNLVTDQPVSYCLAFIIIKTRRELFYYPPSRYRQTPFSQIDHNPRPFRRELKYKILIINKFCKLLMRRLKFKLILFLYSLLRYFFIFGKFYSQQIPFAIYNIFLMVLVFIFLDLSLLQQR